LNSFSVPCNTDQDFTNQRGRVQGVLEGRQPL
jgi:hypothetical protein